MDKVAAELEAEKERFEKTKTTGEPSKPSSVSTSTTIVGKTASTIIQPKRQDDSKKPGVSWAKKLTAASLFATVIGLAALELLGSNPSKKLQRGTDYLSSWIKS